MNIEVEYIDKTSIHICRSKDALNRYTISIHEDPWMNIEVE